MWDSPTATLALPKIWLATPFTRTRGGLALPLAALVSVRSVSARDSPRYSALASPGPGWSECSPERRTPSSARSGTRTADFRRTRRRSDAGGPAYFLRGLFDLGDVRGPNPPRLDARWLRPWCA